MRRALTSTIVALLALLVPVSTSAAVVLRDRVTGVGRVPMNPASGAPGWFLIASVNAWSGTSGKNPQGHLSIKLGHATLASGKVTCQRVVGTAASVGINRTPTNGIYLVVKDNGLQGDLLNVQSGGPANAGGCSNSFRIFMANPLTSVLIPALGTLRVRDNVP